MGARGRRRWEQNTVTQLCERIATPFRARAGCRHRILGIAARHSLLLRDHHTTDGNESGEENSLRA